MALPLANNADGGTNGTTATTANTGGGSGDVFDGVTTGASATTTFDSTVTPRAGGLSYKLTEPTTAVTNYLSWSTSMGTLSTGQRIAGRVYVRISILPSANWSFIRFLNGSTVLGGVRINTTGVLALEASGGSVSGSAGTGTMSTNTWYRVEYDFTALGGTGNGTARLFAGDSTTASGTDSTTSAVSFGTLAPNGVRIGMSATTGMPTSSSWWFDDIQMNTSGMPGPALLDIPSLVMAPMR